MDEETEALVVAAMARAMCAAEGINPDSWKLYSGPARRQYRAHLAMLAILEPPLPEGRWERHTDSDGDAKFIYVPTQGST